MRSESGSVFRLSMDIRKPVTLTYTSNGEPPSPARSVSSYARSPSPGESAAASATSETPLLNDSDVFHLNRAKAVLEFAQAQHTHSAASDFDLKASNVGVRFIACDNTALGALAVRFEDRDDVYVGFAGTRKSEPSTFFTAACIGVCGLKSTEYGFLSSVFQLFEGLAQFSEGETQQAFLTWLKNNGAKGKETALGALQTFVLRAICFADSIIRKHCVDRSRIIICGHSLGGFYAQVVGEYLNLRTITIAAPGAFDIYTDVIDGVSDYVAPVLGQTRPDLFLNVKIRSDHIAGHGTSIGKVITVPADDGVIVFQERTDKFAARKGLNAVWQRMRVSFKLAKFRESKAAAVLYQLLTSGNYVGSSFRLQVYPLLSVDDRKVYYRIYKDTYHHWHGDMKIVHGMHAVVKSVSQRLIHND